LKQLAWKQAFWQPLIYRLFFCPRLSNYRFFGFRSTGFLSRFFFCRVFPSPGFRRLHCFAGFIGAARFRAALFAPGFFWGGALFFRVLALALRLFGGRFLSARCRACFTGH